MSLVELHRGGRSESARRFKVALNKRLHARGLDGYRVHEDDLIDGKTLVAARKTAWALGAMKSTYDSIVPSGTIPVGVQAMVLNPGRRAPQQLDRAKRRIAAMRRARKQRAAASHTISAKRKASCDAAKRSKAAYDRDPHAFHYLAGGKPNTVVMKPTPRDWRSDCSQWNVNIDREAGNDCPGTGTFLYSNTATIAAKGEITQHPQPGDYGMYCYDVNNPRTTTHHTERYIGEPGCMFIGHGSPPIDSATPGLPDYYIKFEG